MKTLNAIMHRNKNLPSIFNSNDRPLLSVELCPHRDFNKKTLQELRPDFCSVIWRSQSEEVLLQTSSIPSISLSNELICGGNQVLLHLAGRHLTKGQVSSILKRTRQLNIRNIFVLQGEVSTEHEDKGDFKYAIDLVKFIRKQYGQYFSIGVAAYPEMHPNSTSKTSDLEYLKNKVDAGADFVITQMVFDVGTFNDFYRQCEEIGIDVPIIPGIFIMDSFKALRLMVRFCKVTVPKNVAVILDNNKHNPDAILNYGIHLCRQFVKRALLHNHGRVVGFHFFSLNKINLVNDVCKSLELYKSHVERPIQVIIV